MRLLVCTPLYNYELNQTHNTVIVGCAWIYCPQEKKIWTFKNRTRNGPTTATVDLSITGFETAWEAQLSCALAECLECAACVFMSRN